MKGASFREGETSENKQNEYKQKRLPKQELRPLKFWSSRKNTSAGRRYLSQYLS